MFILTSLTLPLAAFTAFSSTGVSCLHGPHHGAQKSTSTGWRLDSSITSLTKLCVVVSLTDASAPTVSAGCNMSPAQDFLAQDRSYTRRTGSSLFRQIRWEESRRMQSGLRRPGNRLDPRQMPGGFEEFKEPFAGNRCRAGIHQPMKVEHRVAHPGSVEHNRDEPAGIVDDRERGHRAGLDAEEFAHELGRAEREPPRSAEKPVQRAQFDLGVLTRHDEKRRALFVAQEQVLGMPAGDRTAQPARLPDGKCRR